MKSLAAICWGVNQPWTVEEIEVDPPGPGEVLVEWAAAGLCHSDEGIRTGERVPKEEEASRFPMLGGHEGAGIVADVGPGVTAFSPGDHVLANFVPACGRCRYCATGRGYICDDNKGFAERGQLVDGQIKHRARDQDLFVMAKLGTFAERTVVSQRSLLPLDSDLPLASASLVSCGVTTGWGSAVERGGTGPGDIVVVVGTGGVGFGAVQGARIAGAKHIIAVDLIQNRREMAYKGGATSTAASIAGARDEIAHLTNGQGADVVVLTPSVVTGQLIHDALGITGKGGTCVVTGMAEHGVQPVPMDIGMFALYNKQLLGCLFGSMDPRASAPRLLGLYRQGLLDLDVMVTRYPLPDINEALADSNEGRNIRGVLTMNGLN
jgi:NDMA-dependent alcohol dehydrogenase